MNQGRAEEGVLHVVAIKMLEREGDGTADVIPAVVRSSAKGGLKADRLGVDGLSIGLGIGSAQLT